MGYREALQKRVTERKDEQNRRFSQGKNDVFWLRIGDGDKEKVRILHSPLDAPLIDVHDTRKDKTGDQFLCLAQFGMDCPMCGLKGKDGMKKAILHLFSYVYSQIGKMYEKDNGEKIPEIPVQIFQRTPGKGFANHFELFNLEEQYLQDIPPDEDDVEEAKAAGKEPPKPKKGLGMAGRDFTISRVGSGTDTVYNFMAGEQRKFKRQEELERVTELLGIIESKDLAKMFMLCIRKYRLPDGVTEYPTEEQVQALIDEMMANGPEEPQG